MSWILPTVVILSTILLFVVIIANRSQAVEGINPTKPRSTGAKKRIKIPNVLSAIWSIISSFFTFLFRNWWKVFASVVIAYIAYVIVSLVTSSIETNNNTMYVPRAPFEVVLEPGERSPIFKLNTRGAWKAYLNPCQQILPYVVRFNERMINGVLYFDSYQIHNTSDGSLIFETWQEPTGSQAPRECT